MTDFCVKTLHEISLDTLAQESDGWNEIYADWNDEKLSWATRLQKVTDPNLKKFMEENNITGDDVFKLLAAVKEARNHGISFKSVSGKEFSLEELLTEEEISDKARNFLLDRFFNHDKSDNKDFFNDWDKEKLTWEDAFANTTDNDINTFVTRFNLSDKAKTALQKMIKNLKSEDPDYDIMDYQKHRKLKEAD